ncbi:MAG: transporter, ATP-binding protein [Myxococcaceae bacterium]|nr:transporter, ATP-binding protein [Myxococcaceae bacterium]
MQYDERPEPNRAAPDDPIHVRVVDLKKTYGSTTILKGLTFDMQRGLTNVILGASGSGKTVFLRQLVRLEKPDSGQIIVDGVDIAPLNERELGETRKKFGMVFQMSALFDSMDVFDNVAFPLREHFKKLSRGEVKSKVEEALEALGVAHAVHRQPSELSGGMRKRVAVARAIVMQPAILIYDEPTTGLDPITSRTVDDLIESTRERFGVTSVVISHDMESVFRMGHHITLLYKGQIEESLPRDEFAKSDNEHVREILTASGVNIPGMEGADEPQKLPPIPEPATRKNSAEPSERT